MADGGTPAKKVLIQQVPYDFQSIETEFFIEGKSKDSLGLIDGLEEFDYSCTFNRTIFYGCGQLPIERTEGDAEFSARIQIHRYWFHYLTAKAEEFGIGLINLEMQLTFAYFGKHPHQAQAKPHVDTLTGVKLGAIESSGKHGSSPQMVSLPLDVMNIYWDGVDVTGHSIGKRIGKRA